MAFRLAILDFDGVLTELDIDWSRVREEVSRRIGVRIDSLMGLLVRLWGTELYRVVSGIIEGFELRAIEKAEPFPDTVWALEFLRRRNIRVYMATLQARRPVSIFLERYKLLGYFKGLLTRDEYPDKAMMVKSILSAENARAEEAFLVDDNPAHIVAAEDIGVKGVLVRNSRKAPLLLEALRSLLG
ncbi:MAG: HAD hydrolase-like protein [Pyrodictiaceae archaeon]